MLGGMEIKEDWSTTHPYDWIIFEAETCKTHDKIITFKSLEDLNNYRSSVRGRICTLDNAHSLRVRHYWDEFPFLKVIAQILVWTTSNPPFPFVKLLYPRMVNWYTGYTTPSTYVWLLPNNTMYPIQSKQMSETRKCKYGFCTVQKYLTREEEIELVRVEHQRIVARDPNDIKYGLKWQMASMNDCCVCLEITSNLYCECPSQHIVICQQCATQLSQCPLCQHKFHK